ncbi:hypothetical protein [Maribellus sp. YY47]|uniref:hypothetical protein n=1 Tax=Maribellus sp. YY47 TaxID=2929486 RepID=UPI002001CE8B|nr:hypothetical protein [Maribellus sp. YY47]MCK3686184.1 hypothetical protein [Maribellus sp. YY47]
MITICWWLPFWASGQLLPGFERTSSFNEQQMLLEDSPANTRILINAPLDGFGKHNRVLLIFYALPNGNTIEQTFGKALKEGDDWHFDIQHIGAQTRYLRHVITKETIVVVYLESSHKSWPLWKKDNPDFSFDTKNIVDKITSMFSAWNPEIVLNGHSGGGRFIFSYLEAVQKIPDKVKRIAFLDSDYGYEDSIHGPKLTDWLNSGKDRFLSVLAYNDSVVVYNGKPLVSATGGTWYRSKMMKSYLSRSFQFREELNDSLLWYRSRGNKIEFILKTNPEEKIYHTVQEERNGFIQSMLSGTKHEQKGYRYFGERAYKNYISDAVNPPIRQLNIPPRKTNAETGSVFMKRIENMRLEEREEEIYKALAAGNMPGLLRNTVSLEADFADAEGVVHKVEYQIVPDYLSVGSDDDFCRIPMNPRTAQRLATLFGASLITAKISDDVYQKAEVKLEPFPYKPVGNANETVQKFIDHNTQIERQKAAAGGQNGQIIAGIKKDVILSNHIAQLPDKVVIYGWHKIDGSPIQPVYSGHVYWYVDYSHGIRLMNNQVLLDGKPVLLSEILKDSVLFKVFSNEEAPMLQTVYLTH